MANKRPKPEDIVTKLRQVEVLTGQGMPRLDAIRQIGVTEQTYYRWKKQYGIINEQNFVAPNDQLLRKLVQPQCRCAVQFVTVPVISAINDGRQHSCVLDDRRWRQCLVAHGGHL